ncbi:MAG: HD family phosphohydrolase [Candidatus Eisenbacteria bacterium]
MRETPADTHPRGPTGLRALAPAASRLLRARPLLHRALIVLPVLLGAILLFPPAFESFSKLKVGARAPRTVIAEFEFPVLKDPGQIEQERREQAESSPIALAQDPSVATGVFRDLGEFRSVVQRLRGGSRKSGEVPEVDLSQDLLVWLMLDPDPMPTIEQTESILQEAYERGIADPRIETLRGGSARMLVHDGGGEREVPLEDVMTPAKLAEMAKNRALARGLHPAHFAELVTRFARPNLLYDPERTEEVRLAALEGIDPVALRVQRGERIVEARERVTPDLLAKLESYEQWRARRSSETVATRAVRWAGRMLVLLLAIAIFGAYLRFLRPDTYRKPNDLMLLSLAAGSSLALSGLFLHVFDLPPLMAPVAAAPILIAMLFDERLALVAALGLTGLAGLVGELPLPVIAVLGAGAVVSVFCVRGLRHRRQFYRLVLYVPAAHLLMLAGLALAQGTMLPELLRDALAAVANPVLTAGLAIFFVPLAEHGFRKCSDITLLELSDLNRPLLRRLMVEAPGTYHHSLMVGTLAETAARVVGGNPLLARVIGYYHDIGKVAKPDYFIENIRGRKNPHDRLSPSMSRLILESHVREGVGLAVRERLPHIVQDGIRQHHGGSVMAFFWHKARRQDPNAREEDYRYPGPRPQFREAALVMLADQVDAASRALDDPTASRIKGVVLKVLETRLAEGDLDDCDLTLSDLAKIRDAFVPMLAAFFHARTAYLPPEDDVKRPPTTPARDREPPAKNAS